MRYGRIKKCCVRSVIECMLISSFDKTIHICIFLLSNSSSGYLYNILNDNMETLSYASVLYTLISCESK